MTGNGNGGTGTSRLLVYAGLTTTMLLLGMVMLSRWFAEDIREHMKSTVMHPTAAVDRMGVEIAALRADVSELNARMDRARVRLEAWAALQEQRTATDAQQAALHEAMAEVGRVMAEAVRDLHAETDAKGGKQ